MKDRQQFHKDRMHGIGCSEIAVIMGKSKHSTPYDLWKVKTGRVKPSDKESLAMKHGRLAEQLIADEYASLTGFTLENPQKTIKHPSCPLVGTVDRLVTIPGSTTPNILECKTVSPFQFTAANGWGQDSTSQIPQSYSLQVMGYMALYNSAWADAVLIGGVDFKVFRVRRDLSVEKSILEYVSWWWTHHVVKGNEPTGNDAANAPNTQKTSHYCDEAMTNLILQLADLNVEIDCLNVEKNELIQQIVKRCGSATELRQGEELLAVVRRLKTKTVVELIK